jgi:hypothetical protein
MAVAQVELKKIYYVEYFCFGHFRSCFLFVSYNEINTGIYRAIARHMEVAVRQTELFATE